jgi:hypothetical protein
VPIVPRALNKFGPLTREVVEMRGILWAFLWAVFVVSAWSAARAQGVRPDTSDAAIADSAARFVRLVFSDDPKVRWAAIEELWERKPDGQLAGALAYAIEHDLAPAHKVWLISRIRPGDVYAPLMLDRLAEQEDLRVRLAAIEAIGGTRKPDKETMALLRRLSLDRHLAMRLVAIKALLRMAEPDEETVTLLARLSEDATPEVRIAATTALLRLKRADGETLLWALERLRLDPAPGNRIAILELLRAKTQQNRELQRQFDGLRDSLHWLKGEEVYRECLRDLRGIIEDEGTLRRQTGVTRKAELRRLAVD